MRGPAKLASRLGWLAFSICVPMHMAMAQDSDASPVPIRGGEHGDYSRIVFDWDSAVPYRVSVGSGRLVVSFDDVRDADTRLVNPTILENVSAIDQLSAPGEPLSISLTIEPGTRVRDFNLGPKLVVDIIDDETASEQVADDGAEEEAPPDQAEVVAETSDSEQSGEPEPILVVPPIDPRPAEAAAELANEAADAEIVADTPSEPVDREAAETPEIAEVEGLSAADEAAAEIEFEAEAESVADAIELPDLPEAEEVAEGVATDGEVVDAIEEQTADADLVGDQPSTLDQPDDPILADSEEAEPEAAAVPDIAAAVSEEASQEALVDAEGVDPGEAAAVDEALTEEPVEEELEVAALAPADEQGEDPLDEPAETVEIEPDPQDEPIVIAEPSPPAVPAGQLGAETADKQAVFDPGVQSLLSVFRRGEALWVVIAAETPLDPAALAAQGSRGFGPGEIAAADGGVALRYLVDAALHPTIEAAGTKWTVRLTAEPSENSRLMEVVPQPEFPLGPRVLVEADGVQGLVRVADPEVGDVLVVAPLNVPEMGLSRERRFVEVRLLPSTQGLVAELLADSVTMRIVRQGVEITTNEGLILSPIGDRRASTVNTFGAPIPESLLRVGNWQGPPEQFNRRRQALQRAVSIADDDNLPRARLDLARFYFAHGYGSEAYGLLALMKQVDEGLVDRPDFRALDSAVSMMTGRHDQSVDGFRHSDFDDSEEIALWRAAASASRADWEAASDDFALSRPLIGAYPEPFDDFFFTLAGRTALAVGDIEGLESIIQLMATATDGASDEWDITQYFRGVMALEARDLATADTALTRASRSDDPKIHILARLALVDQGLARSTMSGEEAVDELESLRFAWRGDEIEFDISERLGDQYWEVDRYRDALNLWKRTVDGFPDYPPALALADAVPERLAELILQDPQDNGLNPLRAAAIYNEFKDQLPDGDRGITVSNAVVDKLVSIDLLGRAADLLEEMADETLTGEEAVQASQRRAALHLLQESPELAIVALDDAEQIANVADLPTDLQSDQVLLRADALSRINRPSEALQLIADNPSRIAQAAKVNIAWKAGLWPEAAAALSELVGVPPDNEEPISAGQADTVVNYGIALALADDDQALQELSEQFGPALDESNRAAVFKILTRGDAPLEPIQDLAAVRRQTSEIELFRDFLNGYREAAKTVAATEG